MKKALLISAGALALGLGALGAVLPVLPATPFLLLALCCFAKGSERLNRWFQGTSLYKTYLAEYMQTKSLPLKRKLSIQILAGAMMTVSFILVDSLVPRIILALAFIGHNYVFLFKIKTRKPEPKNDKNLIPDKT